MLYCSDEPFTVRPDPRFQFNSRSFQSAFLSVKGAIDQGASTILLVGAAGSGKTMLLKAVENDYARHGRPVLLRLPNLHFGSGVPAWLLSELGHDLSGTAPEAPLDALRRCLEQKTAPTILLLDGVDDVSDGALSDLLELAVVDPEIAGHLQLVLTGRPQLVERLQAPHFSRSHATVVVRIEPLRRDEVPLYVAHRLASAGRTDTEFEEAAIDLVFRYSEGIPFRVNRICACATSQGRSHVGIAQVETAARICGIGLGSVRPGKSACYHSERRVGRGFVLIATTSLAVFLGSFTIYDAAELRVRDSVDRVVRHASEWQSAALEQLKKTVASIASALDERVTQEAYLSGPPYATEQGTRANHALVRFAIGSGSLERPASGVAAPDAEVDPKLDVPPDRALDASVSMGRSDHSSSENATPLPREFATTGVMHAAPGAATAWLPMDASPERQAPEEGAVTAPRSEPLQILPKITLNEAELRQLMQRGEQLVREGDIASARLIFEYASKWNSDAAVAAGRTYDPIELRKLGIVGIRGDPERAAEWYRRALAAGEQSSRQHLSDLAEWASHQRAER